MSDHDIERVAAYSAPFFADDEGVMRSSAQDALRDSGLSAEDAQRLEDFAVQVGINGLRRFFAFVGEGSEIDVRLSNQDIRRFLFDENRSSISSYSEDDEVEVSVSTEQQENRAMVKGGGSRLW